MATDKTIVIGAAAGALVGAGLGWLALHGGAGDEEGIRVKSGSVDLETISGAGFDHDVFSQKYKAIRRPRGKVFVVASGGTCAGLAFAADVQRLQLTIDTQPIPVEVVSRGKFEVSNADFDLDPSGNLLTNPGKLTRIKAFRGAHLLLDCTDNGSQTLEAVVFVFKN